MYHLSTQPLAAAVALTALAASFMLVTRTSSRADAAPPREVPASNRENGAACSTLSQCTGGICLHRAGWRDGYCAASCGAEPCTEADACVALGDGSLLCLQRCGTGYSCRDGYVCNATVGACLPDCRSGWSCGSTLTCDAERGECVPGPEAVTL